jgi:hypothetical protein
VGEPVSDLKVKLKKTLAANLERRFTLDVEFAVPAGVTVIDRKSVV